MKKTLAALLAIIITLLLFGCEEKPLPERLPEETTAGVTTAPETATAPQITTVPPKTTETVTEAMTVETIPQFSDEVNENIRIAIEFINDKRISNGALYDFDRDGIAEIIVMYPGHSLEMENVIYKLTDGEYKELGVIHSWWDEISLYRNRDTGEYFYIADYFYDNWLNDRGGTETVTEYVFTDSGITAEELCRYSYSRKDTDYGKIKVSGCSFMGKDLPELDGIYPEGAAIGELTGINAYLRKFEEIYVPSFPAEKNRLYYEQTGKVRQLLEDFYKEQEVTPRKLSFTPDKRLKPLFENQEFLRELSWYIDDSKAIKVYDNYLMFDYPGPMSDFCSVYNIRTGKKLGEYEGYAFDVYDDNGTEKYIARSSVFGSSGGRQRICEIILHEDYFELKQLFSVSGLKDYETMDFVYYYYIGGKEVTKEEYDAEYKKFFGGLTKIDTDGNYLPWGNEKQLRSEKEVHDYILEIVGEQAEPDRMLSAIENMKNNSPGMLCDFDFDGTPEHIFFDRSMDFFEPDIYDMACVSAYNNGEFRYLGDVFFYYDTDKKQMYLELYEDEDGNPIYFGQWIATEKNMRPDEGGFLTSAWLIAYSFADGKFQKNAVVKAEWDYKDESGLGKFEKACEKELSKYKKAKRVYFAPDWDKLDSGKTELSYEKAVKKTTE